MSVPGCNVAYDMQMTNTNIDSSEPPTLDPDRISALPNDPGVYLFKDCQGVVIYVGKATSLRSRVRSYFGSQRGMTQKNQALVERIADIEVVVGRTEAEALLLENNLIKQHRPRFNIALRDDKSFLYIKVVSSEAFPRVTTTRRVLEDGAQYFGPYANAKSLRRTLKLLNKLFPFRTCALDLAREWDRPCLKYHIDLCNGPCIRAVTNAEYDGVIDSTIGFLRGRHAPIVADLQIEMEAAAGDLRYEAAALARDRLRAVERVMAGQQAVDDRAGDIDAIGIAQEGRLAIGYVLNVRSGRIVGNSEYALKLPGADDPGEIASEFLREYYSRATDLPSLVLIPASFSAAPLVASWLSQRAGRRVELRFPQRGPRRDLLAMAVTNASAAMGIERRAMVGSKRRLHHALEQIGEALALRRLPRRIECFDVSHLQGSNVVASMVVFVDGQPAKSQYRRFRIKGDWGNDDFASMREVIGRRFKRQSKTDGENGDSFVNIPDLVIVDGGRGQLSAALSAMEDHRAIAVPLIALAKREEEIFTTNSPHPLRLNQTSDGLYLLQRIRDEAHRFAVSYHAKLRSRSGRVSGLDSVPGIGSNRRRLLIKRFGSLAAVRVASVEELTSVPGIGPSIAKSIHESLAR